MGGSYLCSSLEGCTPNPELASFYIEAFSSGGHSVCHPALKAPGDELSWTGLLSPFPDWILLPLPFPHHFLDNETPALGFA